MTSDPQPNSLLSRLGSLLGNALLLLDPAFLVPGVTALLAFLFPLIYQGRVSAAIGWSPRAFGLAFLAYAIGFVCCSLGGLLRRRVTRLLRPRAHFHVRMHKLFVGHRFATTLDPPWSEGARTPWGDYTSARQAYRAMRAAVAQPGLEVAQRALRVRSGLVTCYDGLALALLTWAVVFWLVPRYVQAWPTPWNASIIIGGVLGLLAFTCWSEAERQQKEEPREVVAALAASLRLGAPAEVTAGSERPA